MRYWLLISFNLILFLYPGKILGQTSQSTDIPLSFDSVATAILKPSNSVDREWSYNKYMEECNAKYVGHIVTLTDCDNTFLYLVGEKEQSKLFKPRVLPYGVKSDKKAMINHYLASTDISETRYSVNYNVKKKDISPKKSYIGKLQECTDFISHEFQIMGFTRHVSTDRIAKYGSLNYRIILKSLQTDSYYYILADMFENYTKLHFVNSGSVIERRAIQAQREAEERAIREAEMLIQKQKEDSIKQRELEIKRQLSEQQRRLEREKEEAERIAREKEKIRKWGKKNYDLVSEGIVRIGMTREMCVEAWGYPITVNEMTTRYGTSEQWVYEDFNYIFFENGKVSGIHTSN